MRKRTDLRDERSFDHVGRDRGNNFVAGEVLADLADSDQRIVAGAADLTYVTQMTPFAERHPDRYIQFGISERHMLSTAAGLATCGLLPYMATFASFSALQAFENIRTDHAYPRLPVRVVATHAGIAMGFFGTSHHATEDIAALRAISGLTIVSPADAVSTAALLRSTVDHPGPIYFRLGRGREGAVYETLPADFSLGTPQLVRRGSDVLLVSTGAMVEPCLGAADRLDESGLRAGVLDVHCLKPFPAEAITEQAADHTAVVVVEEHNTEGGLGTLVTEALAARGHTVPVYKHGLRDEFGIVGPPSHLYRYYGLDATGIATLSRRVLDLVDDRKFFALGGATLWTDTDKAAVLEETRR